MRGQLDAVEAGLEGDVEVMRAGHAVGRGAGKGLAHHAAQGRLDHFVVSQQVFHGAVTLGG